MRVDAVTKGGPGAEAGLRSGDVIVKVQGEEHLHADTLAHLAVVSETGDRFELDFRRDSGSQQTMVTLK